MAGFYGIEQREVIRVKVKKCEGFMKPEYKKFSVDPQITSFEMLQHILANAFGIKGDMSISYRAVDTEGQEVYLSMLSDWDMDAAFQSASDPCLHLKVDLKPFEEGLDDWDIIAPVDVPQHKVSAFGEKHSLLSTVTGAISNQMGRTMNQMQKAMGLKTEDTNMYKPSKPPMTDQEFRNYLDSAGHMVKPEEFRLSIYQGGVEPSLRRVVWRHLLNIFPAGLSGKERFEYMKKKENEYFKLRDDWRQTASLNEDLKLVITLVKKDVLRTDRTHKFYSGNDDNKNVMALFNILVTYAITHPEVSYCQGMSDVASTLLVTQKEEAQAYLCFCSIMERMHANFMLNENLMNTKFKHLGDVIKLHDPVLFSYLKDINANDLFFCYRWLLLELKREFPLDDALYMLEVMWSTLPPNPPEKELQLTDPCYNRAFLSNSPCSPSFSIKQTVYTKLLAQRLHRRTKSCNVPKSLEENKMCNSCEDEKNSVNNNSIPISKNVPDRESPFEDEKSLLDMQNFPSMKDSMVAEVRAQSCSIDKALEKSTTPCKSAPALLSALTVVNEGEPGALSVVMEKMDRKDSGNVSDQDVEVSGEYDPDKTETETEPVDIPGGHSSGDNDSAMLLNGSDCFGLPITVTSSYHDDIPAGTIYNGNFVINSDGLSDEVANNNEDENNINGETDVDLGIEKGFADSVDKLESSLREEDTVQSQFYISLDSDRDEIKTSSTDNKPQHMTKKMSFFQNVKDFISTPKKRPSNIPIGKKVTGFKEPEVVQQENEKSSTNHPNTSSSSGGESDVLFEQVPKESTALKAAPVQIKGEGTSVIPQRVICKDLNDSGLNLSLADENSLEFVKHDSISVELPPPEEFGGGNPFLMFLCVTLLLQHRNTILQNRLEYDEIAMMFDKMVRKHNVHKVLHQARLLYTDYLHSQRKKEELTREMDSLSV